MKSKNKLKKILVMFALVLLVAAPLSRVSADDDDDEDRNRNEERSSEERSGKIESKLQIEKNGKAEVKGAVFQSISTGNIFTVKIFGMTITVDGSRTRITSSNNNNVSPSSIPAGAILEIKGTFNSSTGILTASSIKILSRIIVPPTDTTPPVITSITVTNIASTSATVNWTTNENSTSKVYYGTSSPLNLATALNITNATLLTGHSLGLSGLVASTTYYIVVESTNAANLVSTSSQMSFTTSASAPPIDTTPPVISAVAVANIATSSATVNWATNENSTSKAYYGTSSPLNLATALNVTNATLLTGHALNLSGLAASTTYFVVVESTNAANLVSTSSQTTFTTNPVVVVPPVDTTPPVISLANIVDVATSSATVNWTTNENSTSKVYYGTSSPLNLATALNVSNPALTLSHSLGLSGLTANTTYNVVIESTNLVNLTSTSSQMSFTTSAVVNQVVLTTALVAQHNLRTNCWMIINGSVYNLTDFVSPINEHEGGLNAIVSRCGTDGTVAFDNIGHSPQAIALLDTFFLGDVGETVTLP